MKKILLMVAAGFFALTGKAQIVSSTSRNITQTTYEIEEEETERKNVFAFDFSVGKMATKVYDEKNAKGAFGFGFHFEHRFNKYFAWDIFSVGWDAPFDSPADTDRVMVRTGFRGFSPKFAKNMRAYAHLDLGYAAYIAETASVYSYSYYDSYYRTYYPRYSYDYEMKASHGFGLEFGFGLHLTKHLSVGYALDWDTSSKVKGNYFRFGVLF